MRLEKIQIRNFLSVKDMDLDCSDITVIVGPNNHGKTNILRALDFFFNGTKLSWGDLITKGSTGSITVTCQFSGIDEYVPLLNEKHQEAFRKNILPGDKIWFQRKYESNGKVGDVKIYDTDKEIEINVTGFTNANTLLPKFEFVPTSMVLDDATKTQKTSYLGRMIFDIFSKITPEKDKQYIEHWEKIEEYFNERDNNPSIKEVSKLETLIHTNLVKEFPECRRVKLKVELPKIDDIIKGFGIKIDDGVETDAICKGDGMQRALMFSVIKSYADYQKTNINKNESDETETKREPPIIFAIDEADLHLHPKSQKDMLSTFESITQNEDQVFYTTHSYVMAKKTKNNNVYGVVKIDNITIKQDDSKSSVMELLGLTPSDDDLPNNIIIAEGISDAIFLNKIMELKGITHITVHFACGDSNIVNATEAINQMFRTFFYTPIYKDTVCAIFDKQNNQKNIDDFKKYVCKEDPADRLLELDKNGIEYYYPKNILKGFFDGDPADLEIEQKIDEFLVQAKVSDKGEGVFGNLGIISKGKLAEKVTEKMDFTSLEIIDQQIIQFIENAKNLSY